MAVFINGTIAPDCWVDSFMGEETVSLVDVIAQVKTQDLASPVTVYINSPGGVVTEGYAIHDYLRNLGRPIKTIAINQCASIATVVFLAGDDRISRCPLMIHNPWSTYQGDAASVAQGVDELEKCEKELEQFYAKKLDIDAATISTLMANETLIDPDQALSLGFATAKDEEHPAVALTLAQSKQTNNKKTNAKMKVKIKNALTILSNLLGGVVNMELTTADGTALTVEREDGDPQVGDIASPDGEHVMPDGSTITVSDGLISEISEAEAEPTIEEQLAQANARIAEMEATVVTPENRVILDAVSALGGAQALAKLCSTYQPAVREGARAAVAPHTPAYKNRLTQLKNKQRNNG